LRDADGLDRVASVILNAYFSPSPGQRVMVLTGQGKRALAERLWSRLARRGARPELVVVTEDAPALPEACLDAFGCSRTGLIILASPRMWFELGLSELLVACQPLFFDEMMPLDSLVRIYSCDPAEDRRYLSDLLARLQDHARVRVTSPGGTDLTFVSRKWTIHGRELLTSPLEESVEGTVVADASVYLGKVSSPIILTVKKGRLTELSCADPDDSVFCMYRDEVLGRLQLYPTDGQLAEVGLGGSAGAIVSGCIMEDESVRGTCHVCFGDNSRYGGANYSLWHGGTAVISHVQVEQHPASATSSLLETA